MTRIAVALAVLWCAMSCLHATDNAQSALAARGAPAGVVRIWGNAELEPLLEGWMGALHDQHAGLTFDAHLTGSDVGMAALYTGKADIVLTGREATANELKAFEWVFRFKPSSVQLATGSLDAPGKSPALVVFVHHDNPLAALTLAQLDAIFGHERLRGAPRALETWGALGLGGEWTGRPINLYLFDTESGSGRYFRKAVLEDSRMLNWERIREFTGSGRFGGQRHDADTRILDALAHDRFGLAVSSLAGRNGEVRALPLARADGEEPIPATRATLIARSYPLTRSVFAYFKRAPDAAMDKNVEVLLRHALSTRGQGAVEQERGYLPLQREIADRQLGILE